MFTNTAAATRNMLGWQQAQYLVVAQNRMNQMHPPPMRATVLRVRPSLLVKAITSSVQHRSRRNFITYICVLTPRSAYIIGHCSLLVTPIEAASALRKLGRNEQATAELLKAADASPCDAHVQYKLGQHLRSIGDSSSAEVAYGRALELDPGHALAAFWLPATRRLASGGIH